MSSDICFLKNLLNNIFPVNVGLYLSFTTFLKYYFLASRSMLEMNESKIAKFTFGIISSVSLMVCGIKFSGDTKPTFNQVSNLFSFSGKEIRLSKLDM